MAITYTVRKPGPYGAKTYGRGEPITSADIGNPRVERVLVKQKWIIAPEDTAPKTYTVRAAEFKWRELDFQRGDTITSFDIGDIRKERKLVELGYLVECPETTPEVEPESVQSSVLATRIDELEKRPRGRPRSNRK